MLGEVLGEVLGKVLGEVLGVKCLVKCLGKCLVKCLVKCLGRCVGTCLGKCSVKCLVKCSAARLCVDFLESLPNLAAPHRVFRISLLEMRAEVQERVREEKALLFQAQVPCRKRKVPY